MVSTRKPLPIAELPPTTLQIHRDGHWHAAATVQSLGAARCRIEYLPEYVYGAAKPWLVALGLPIDSAPDRFVVGPMGREADRQPPAFLYDLVPQGKGRQYLLEQLQLADSDNLVMPLAMAGAIAPIGCLRFQSAAGYFEDQNRPRAGPAFQGFDEAEVRGRGQDVVDHLARNAMLAAGTTGVQGVAPKFLLSTNRDGRWFPDLALPDQEAQEHWLIKLPRGKSDEDRAVLRNEAGYLRLAAACGMKTMAEPKLHGEILLVRRFDRQVIDGQVHRLHQESLASVCDLRGFGIPKSQQTLLQGLRAAVTCPRSTGPARPGTSANPTTRVARASLPRSRSVARRAQACSRTSCGAFTESMPASVTLRRMKGNTEPGRFAPCANPNAATAPR